jgi:hypothetical protein
MVNYHRDPNRPEESAVPRSAEAAPEDPALDLLEKTAPGLTKRLLPVLGAAALATIFVLGARRMGRR